MCDQDFNISAFMVPHYLPVVSLGFAHTQDKSRKTRNPWKPVAAAGKEKENGGCLPALISGAFPHSPFLHYHDYGVALAAASAK